MEENEPVNADYLKGFNEGYLMKKHLPDIADKLAGAMGDSPRGHGFQDGRNQVVLELEKDLYPDWLKSDRLSTPDEPSDRSKEKDKDIDLEIDDPQF